MAPPWDRGKDGKLIQMIKVICCNSLLSAPGPGAFSRDFTTNLAPQCRDFSRALKSEKLKARARYFPALRGWGIQMTGALWLDHCGLSTPALLVLSPQS